MVAAAVRSKMRRHTRGATGTLLALTAASSAVSVWFLLHQGSGHDADLLGFAFGGAVAPRSEARSSSRVICYNAAKRQGTGRRSPDGVFEKRHGEFNRRMPQHYREYLWHFYEKNFIRKYDHFKRQAHQMMEEKVDYFSQTLMLHWPEGQDEVVTQEEVKAHFTTDDYAPEAVIVGYKDPWNSHRKAFVHFDSTEAAKKARKGQGEGTIGDTQYVARIAKEKKWIAVRDGMRNSVRKASWERDHWDKAYGEEKYDYWDDGETGKQPSFYYGMAKTWAEYGSATNPWYPNERPTKVRPHFKGHEKEVAAHRDGLAIEYDGNGVVPWPTYNDPKGKEIIDQSSHGEDPQKQTVDSSQLGVKAGTPGRPSPDFIPAQKDTPFDRNYRGSTSTFKGDHSKWQAKTWHPKDHWVKEAR